MAKLFGTDGIRGVAGQYPITPEIGIKLGRAVVRFCRERGLSTDVIIGRDTRASGEMLEHGVISGILSTGGNAFDAGVIPTPGVAFLARDLKCGAGVVLSASHNPHEYNGFKLFSHEGYKFSNDEENEIESYIFVGEESPFTPDHGRFEKLGDATARYVSFLKKNIPQDMDLSSLKIVLDCANGATFQAAPALFKQLGIETEALFIAPDGKNINLDCGSQHTDSIANEVLKYGADAGLAFDGDGDRLIAVDERGRVLTGDQLMTIFAKMLIELKELNNSIVVSTVMSNIGLKLGLKELGVVHIATDVGDRYVMEEMRRQDSVLGGEDSGHIIFLDHHTTGDGIIAGIQLLCAMKYFNEPLFKLSGLMKVYPQRVVNVTVNRKPEISTVPEILEVIEKVEKELSENGRVLVRYSGTEPVCRVMVEGNDDDIIEKHAQYIAGVIRKILN